MIAPLTWRGRYHSTLTDKVVVEEETGLTCGGCCFLVHCGIAPDVAIDLPPEKIESDENFFRQRGIEPPGPLVRYRRVQHGFASHYVLESAVDKGRSEIGNG